MSEDVEPPKSPLHFRESISLHLWARREHAIRVVTTASAVPRFVYAGGLVSLDLEFQRPEQSTFEAQRRVRQTATTLRGGEQ